MAYYKNCILSGDKNRTRSGIKGMLNIGDRGKVWISNWFNEVLHGSDNRRKVVAIDALLSLDEKGREVIAKGLSCKEQSANLLYRWWNRISNKSGCGFHGKLADGTKTYSPALSNAVECGFINVIALFIAKGADVNELDSIGGTSLHWAARSGYPDTVKLLISNGAKVNIRDVFGQTPMHLAVQGNEYEAVIVLVSNGGDTDIRDNKGKTPLHIAANADYRNIVEFLIENHADMNVLNAKGETPLDITYTKETKDLLISLGAKSVDELKKEQEQETK